MYLGIHNYFFNKHFNVRTQKFLIMKNYLITSFNTSLGCIIALFMVLTSSDTKAQTVTVALEGTMDVAFCVESTDTLCFDVSVLDADGQAVSLLSLQSASWIGPNGFNSSDVEPCVAIDDVEVGGTYTLTVTFNNGSTAEGEIEFDVFNTFEFEDEETEFVFPDLMDDDCIINYTFDGITLDAVNCDDGMQTACARLVDSDGMTIATSMEISVDPLDPSRLYGALSATDIGFGDFQLIVDFKSDGDVLGQMISTVSAIESRNNITCNDLVNFTLTNNCEGLVTPDMVLEGDFCFDMFELDLEHTELGTELSGTGEVMINEPGLYNVTVTGLSGLSCWSQILAEDKSTPELECQDPVDVYCSQNAFSPGAQICGYGRFAVTEASVAAGTSTVMLPLVSTQGAPTGTVKSIVLNIDGDIDRVMDLAFSLVSPEGLVAELVNFNDPAFASGTMCDQPNFFLCLADDPSFNSYGSFFGLDACRRQVNGYIGNFQPATPFSTFTGEDVVGNWSLEVTAATPVSDLNASLVILTNEGTLAATNDIMQNTGCPSSVITMDFEDEVLSDNCASGNWLVVNRTFTVTNESTNVSESCSQVINFLPWTLEDVIFPKSMDGVESEVIDCSILFDADYNLNPSLVDSEGIPLPSLSGEPRVPFGELCGNFEVMSEDLVLDLCGEFSKKVVRRWSILDWCTGSFREETQIIKIEDLQPLQVSCASETNGGIPLTDSDGNQITGDDGQLLFFFPGTTDANQCAGTWDIIPPVLVQNACDAHEFDFTVEFLIADAAGAPPIDGDYVSFDSETGASVNGTINPTSISNLPLGITWLRYSVEDECGNTGQCFTEVAIVDESSPTPVCIENTVVAIGDDGTAFLPAASIDNGSFDNCGVVSRGISRFANGPFTDVLEYRCGCVMNDERVYLEVTDAAGNSNICAVTVEVQNNQDSPQLSGGPMSMSRDCDSGSFDLFSISEAGRATFNLTANCPTTTGFTVEATFNGQVIRPGDTFEPGECGAGSATIKYEVTDACGSIVGSAFNQGISFTNDFSGFSVNRFPQDIDIDNCTGGTQPEDLPFEAGAGYIQTTSSGCGSDVAISFSDEVFPDVEDACYKILRTWTVIDWCIVNAPGNSVEDGRRTGTQLIVVNDSSAPVITNLRDVTSNDPSCQTLLTEDDVDFEISDNCTAVEDVIVNFLVDGNPTSNIFNQFYNSGTTITIEVEDQCSNVNTFSFRVFNNDELPPTPYCNSQVVTTLNPSGIAEVWVSDYSQGADDNCDPQVSDFFINDLGQRTQVLSFDCEDIPNGIETLIPITVYFEDDSGNQNTCNVSLILQDNSDVCLNSPGSLIAGSVQTDDARMVQDVQVALMSNNVMREMSITKNTGDYAFHAVETNNSYSVVPHKNDNVHNGVNTVDLILIQRHILGLNRFDSPYKVIAADTDNDNRITGADLVELRKLILGVTSTFPNGQLSWRIPVKDQLFVNENNPFPYAEDITINNLGENVTNQDFVAVKIGDVNYSSVASLTEGEALTTRSSKTLSLSIEDQTLYSGDYVTIPVTAENMVDIAGLQSTISFNAASMTFEGVTPGALNLNEANLGLHNVEHGYISLSWNELNGISVDANTVLFEMTFNVLDDVTLSEQLFLSSAQTTSEAYTGSMETVSLKLNFEGAEYDEFVLFQNIPNPFADNTEVRFSLPGQSDVTLTVFDVAGRELLRKVSNYEGGSHTILLNSGELSSTGVMYYKLESAYGTASRRMIQIR